MDDRAARDALRDVVALVTANMQNPKGAATVPLARTISAPRADEPLGDWYDRLVLMLDVTANLASSFLARWAGTGPIGAPDLLRIFAEGLETEMTRRDLASGD